MSDVVREFRQTHNLGAAANSSVVRDVVLAAVTFIATFAFFSLVVTQLFFTDPSAQSAADRDGQREPLNFAATERGLSVIDEFVPATEEPAFALPKVDAGISDIVFPTVMAIIAGFVLISMWFRSGHQMAEAFDTSPVSYAADFEPRLAVAVGGDNASRDDNASFALRSREYVAAPARPTAAVKDAVARRRSAAAGGAFRQEPGLA